MQAILVGQGSMGSRHLSRLSALGVLFVATLDSEEEVDRFLPSLEGVSTLNTFVLIASPASTHATYAALFLEKGFSVFVEKPLATSAIDARNLQALRRPEQVLFVGHSERYSSEFRLFHDTFLKKKPQIESVRFTRHNQPSLRGRDVNVALDLLVHDLDCFFSLLSKEQNRLSFQILNSHLSADGNQATLKLQQPLKNRDPLIVEFEVKRNAASAERKLELFDFQDNPIAFYSFLAPRKNAKDALFYEYEAFFSALKAPNSPTQKERIESACLAVEMASSLQN